MVVIGTGVFGYIRELEIRLEYAERTITGAREIVERTGSQLEQSAGNLHEASRVIGEEYYQIKRLDNWLNNRNTSGEGSGDSAGVDTNKVTGR